MTMRETNPGRYTYRELTKWLHHPMETPPLLPVAEQLSFVMG